jgi:hypothetical protein
MDIKSPELKWAKFKEDFDELRLNKWKVIIYFEVSLFHMHF